jgi:hypothetical protein
MISGLALKEGAAASVLSSMDSLTTASVGGTGEWTSVILDAVFLQCLGLSQMGLFRWCGTGGGARDVAEARAWNWRSNGMTIPPVVARDGLEGRECEGCLSFPMQIPTHIRKKSSSSLRLTGAVKIETFGLLMIDAPTLFHRFAPNHFGSS